MKIFFDGEEYKVKLVKKEINDGYKSKGHKECREILKELYPSDNIFEEITIWPGLIVDFILPLRKLVVEIQGRQHDEFCPFFHGTMIKFNSQKNRDKKKEEICKANKLTLVHLYDKDKSIWKGKILGAFNE